MTTVDAHHQPHDPSPDHGDGHDDGHGHIPHLGHHWDSLQQQFEAGKLGMWLFLATEVLLFGGLFCAYAVWRSNHPDLFRFGSKFLDTNMGATNTAVLILSSLTMAWGVTCAQKNQRKGLIICLILTLMGAATFMVIKYFEYTHKFHEGYYPGIKFYEKPGGQSSYWPHEGELAHGAGNTLGAASPTAAHSETTPALPGAAPAAAAASLVSPGPGIPAVEPSVVPIPPAGPQGLATNAELIEKPFELAPRHTGEHEHPLLDQHRPTNAHMFFNIYFMMTGLHGIHVVIGMVVLTWLLWRAIRGDFNSNYFTPVDLGGLYWHIVDLIWIFLFPLFYLI